MASPPLDGPTIKRQRSELVARADLSGRPLARRLARQVDGWFETLGANLPPGYCLVATGGYAAGALCPGSDVDVVLLHPPRAAAEQVSAAAESLWYPLWDGGVKLSPAVHSPRSILGLAGDDLVTATAILRLRPLAGDSSGVDDLRKSGREQWRKRSNHWLTELRIATEQRWARTGEVASRLEPDVKDGQGGLRDHDVLRWAVAVERADIDAALEAPLDDLAGAVETIFDVRCELHRVIGRATNTLLLQDQDAVAEAMGYADADVLMSKLSAAARSIDWASERFWWRVERVVRLGRRSTTGVPRADADKASGAVVIDDEVELAPGIELDDQSLAFRVAAAAAHAGRPIGRRALVTLAAHPVDENAPWTERTARAFISLLGSGDHVVATIEALEQYDLFSRLLPEWRHIRSLPQRNAFHTYTVDRHVLQTVANANELVRTVARPDLLLVAALLHDIGKGLPGDHTDAGMALVEKMAPRMGFVPTDVTIVRALVEHHLLLAETAMRRDLSDPRTAKNVAEALGMPAVLELLHALTKADSLATGPSAWSAWKETMIQTLVDLVRAEFAQSAPDPEAAVAAMRIDEQLARLADVVRSDRTPRVERENEGEFELLRVGAVDEPGLFAKIAGTLTGLGLDVLGADAWTSPDGIAVDQFRVASSSGVPLRRSRIENELRTVLSGAADVTGRLQHRMSAYAKARRRPSSATPPRREIIISNEASDTTTMIDVRTADELAVLYRLCAAIADEGLDIRSAKVATLGHEVVDVFYVQRIDASRHEALRERLEKALVG